jgi:hypothetical protein
MTGNYKDYALMWYDDPEEECIDWFWSYLGDDDVLPKEFLEYIHQLADDVITGKEKVYPIDDVIDRVKNLVGDMIDD